VNDQAIAAIRRAAADIADGQARLVERITAELEFAQELASLHPAKAASWKKRIAEASRIMLDVLAGGGRRASGAVRGKHASPLRAEAWHPAGRASLGKAVAQAEKVLSPIAKAAKSYTIHCVGHAHIDMNWQWPWPETVAVVNDTFGTVLRLMDEFEDFRFTQSQASVYEIARQYHPELFEQIRRRVAEGRWEVAAVHWVEGDKNLVCGESLARHLLYTRRYMAEQFALRPADAALDWEPDTFGHACTIPSIVSRGGVRRYYLCRCGAGDRPPVFWWRGPDGSRVLVNRETTWYLNHVGTHNAAAMAAFCRKTGLTDWMLVYGVGDHGGGPTRRDIMLAGEMNSWPVYPSFRFATTGSFYDILEAAGARWPTVEGELNYEFTGCYTSQSAIKRANRACESNLQRAESAAAVAWRAAGRQYPAGQLREAWVKTLFGHFHDILPGSCVPATRDYHLGKAQEVLAASGMIQTNALRALAGMIDTSFAGPAAPAEPRQPAARAFGAGAGRSSDGGDVSAATHAASAKSALVVFNPTLAPRSEVVTATLWNVGSAGPFVVRGPDGRAVPAQQVAAGSYWGHEFVELAFPTSVGALGFSAHVIEQGEADSPAGAVRCAAVMHGPERVRYGELAIENEHLAVTFDSRTGGIARLVDKAAGCDLADPADPLAVLEFVLERPRNMSSWVVAEPRRLSAAEVLSMDYGRQGPHVATVEARLKAGDSDITVTYALSAGSRRLDVRVHVNWLERGRAETGTPSLRMRFPVGVARAGGRYEVPFGSIERPAQPGLEVPALRWADVTGTVPGRKGRAGLALLNDCKHGHSLAGSTLRLNLIRSTYSPDASPEIGEHEINLSLAPHGRPLAEAELHRMAAALNQPLAVVNTDVHGGPMPPSASGVAACKPAGVVACGVKKAEDDDALIFRLLETAGRRASAAVSLDPRLMGKVAAAVEVDLLERPLARSTAKLAANGFRVAVPARGIASVKVSFRR